jgi:hypothetical protein
VGKFEISTDVEDEGKPKAYGDHGILRQLSNSLFNLVQVQYSNVIAESYAIFKRGTAKIGNQFRSGQHDAI